MLIPVIVKVSVLGYFPLTIVNLFILFMGDDIQLYTSTTLNDHHI